MSSASRAPKRARIPLLSVLAGVGLLGAAASFLDAPGVVPLFQALAPTVGAVGLLVVAAAAVGRRWWTALAAALASATLIAPVVALPPPPASTTGPRLSVLAINTLYGGADAQRIVDLVRERRVDVLVLTEIHTPLWDRLTQHGLARSLPYATGRSGGAGGTIIATAEPVRCVDLPESARCGQVVTRPRNGYAGRDASGDYSFDMPTVRLADGTLLRGVHAWSPRLAPLERWHSQQSDLADWVGAHADEPRLVMAGDFNGSMSHPSFRAVARGFDHSPRGMLPWVRTWPRSPQAPGIPFVQIDHVLARGWKAVDQAVLRVEGSDHDAVWSLLERTPPRSD
ncbi:endonuclease/exonuclease/phosphatase family protein [Gephyromycinifex aptenodytis]|uniref:endonuclease/exonuclease/phosphatase family protein n=1 Tax=Gephyromycinifex aptenodytis TaxID=2716227 RepID=UPI001444F25A|nr:endonuclease/exonuclease/phosphatase family protein [Gephyromycinifex aptenodytis]